MPTPARSIASLLFAVLLASAASVRAQAPAGTVASLQGRAESQRAGQPAWRALAAGTDVFVGERIRTAESSRVKILMRDDSVITLGAKSELVVDQMVVGADTSTSRMDAVVGAVRAVVTDRYGARGSSFEVKTPTAVAGVRGTGFLLLIDSDGKRTRVVGLYDTTWVRSVMDARGLHEVSVGPGQMTEVLAGGQPSKPRDLSESELDTLAASTIMAAGPTGDQPPPGGGAGAPGEEPGTAGTPALGGIGNSGDAPTEGSGDPGDPATPGLPGGGSIQRPDGVIDQPLDQIRRRDGLPPPPPPTRR
jgi:hypothetical protein